MKVVIDANIIISALRFGGVPRQIIESIHKGESLGFTSSTAIQEVEAVFLRKFRISSFEWVMISEVLRTTFTVLPTHQIIKIPTLRDLNDVHILEAAEVCGADYIISGDKDLLVLESYKGIPIIRAADYKLIQSNHG